MSTVRLFSRCCRQQRLGSYAPAIFSRQASVARSEVVPAALHQGHASLAMQMRCNSIMASASVELPRGITYCAFGNVYVSVTNECNAELTMLAANGPGFTFPPGTDFEPLPEGVQPTGKEVAESALRECRRLNQADGFKEGGREVVFAGLGEPLVRVAELVDAITLLSDCKEVGAIRLNTNGLIAGTDAALVAKKLRRAGLLSVCVQLQTADPSQHATLVQPKNGLCFLDACRFVSALVEAGLQVECSAIALPDVDLEAVKNLSINVLHAESFKARPYFP